MEGLGGALVIGGAILLSTIISVTTKKSARTFLGYIELIEGEIYIVQLTITNQSTRLGTPVEAELGIGISAATEKISIIPSQLSREHFGPGETRTFGYSMPIPMGSAGQTIALCAWVENPAGKMITSASEDITIVVASITTPYGTWTPCVPEYWEEFFIELKPSIDAFIYRGEILSEVVARATGWRGGDENYWAYVTGIVPRDCRTWEEMLLAMGGELVAPDLEKVISSTTYPGARDAAQLIEAGIPVSDAARSSWIPPYTAQTAMIGLSGTVERVYVEGDFYITYNMTLEEAINHRIPIPPARKLIREITITGINPSDICWLVNITDTWIGEINTEAIRAKTQVEAWKDFLAKVGWSFTDKI